MMTLFIQYAPYALRSDGVASGENWDDAARDALRDTVFDKIEGVCPGFRDRVLHAEVRTPRDIEREVGLTEGNIFQGELTFDQLLFNRPVPGWAQYRSPVRGLYLVGSSAHPGGGVMAAPGANAAREILRDLKRAAPARARLPGRVMAFDRNRGGARRRHRRRRQRPDRRLGAGAPRARRHRRSSAPTRRAAWPRAPAARSSWRSSSADRTRRRWPSWGSCATICGSGRRCRPWRSTPAGGMSCSGRAGCASPMGRRTRMPPPSRR